MQYKRHKGEKLSVIGIGCYGISGAYGKKDPESFIPLLRRAYELGVIFFDTADVYGPAEEILGRAVAPFRDQVWIATKVGARADGKPDCSPQHLRDSCEQSLQRLETDHIDLYQIHFQDPDTPVVETVAALEALQAAGKIRYYGVGHLSPPKLRAYLAHGEPFSALTELSAVARRARQEILPLCREHDVAALAFSVTGRGLLTGKIGPRHSFEEGDIRRIDPLFQRERFASGLRVAKRLQEIGAKHDKTPAQVAIAWVLAQPSVVCALTGPSTIPHLEENLATTGWSIPPEILADLEQFLQQEEAWLRRQQYQNVRALLAKPLEPQSAFADLVYLLETLVELELASETQILPLFHRLLSLRGQKDVSGLAEMETLQAELRDEFLSLLNPAGEERND